MLWVKGGKRGYRSVNGKGIYAVRPHGLSRLRPGSTSYASVMKVLGKNQSVVMIPSCVGPIQRETTRTAYSDGALAFHVSDFEDRRHLTARPGYSVRD